MFFIVTLKFKGKMLLFLIFICFTNYLHNLPVGTIYYTLTFFCSRWVS